MENWCTTTPTFDRNWPTSAFNPSNSSASASRPCAAGSTNKRPFFIP